MPGSIKKDLYLAKSVHALNELASAIPKVNSARMYATTAEKVYRGAEEAYMLGDEERSYVLYMKYFNVVSAIKKSADYKKQSKFIDELIGKKNCLNAITKAEELSASLKTRYEEAEAIEVSKKLDSLEIKKNSEDSEESEKLEDSSGAKEKADDDSTATQSKADDKSGTGVVGGGMDVHTIYRLLKDPDIKLILMDVRSTNDFTESHISSAKVISVPESAVAPGCTVSQIEKHLPAESRKIWKTRGSVDYVVLFDWRCSAATLVARSTLTYLKDALFKWDQETILRSEPLIMDGGYEEWLSCYPPLTTNPGVRCPLPPVHAAAPDLPSLDSIDYDVELDFLKSPIPAPEEQPEPSESAVPAPVLQPAAVPRFDRSTKPKPGAVMNNATSAVPKDSKPDFSGVRIVNKINHSSNSPPANRKVENIPPTPKANISDKNTNAIGSTLPGAATAAAAAAAVPSVDRTKKPSKTVSQPPAVTVRPSFSSSEDEDEGPLPGVREEGASGGGFGGVGAAELKQLMELRNLKEQEAKSLADIMRKKKKMEEEMKKEEKEAQRKRIERNENLERREADNRSTGTDGLSSPESIEKEAVNQVNSPYDSDSDEQTSSETNYITVTPSTAASEKMDDAKITEQEKQKKEEELEEERRKIKEREQADEREAEKQRQAELEAEKKHRAELESAAKEAERAKAELLKQRELEAAKIQQKEREAKEKEKQAHDAEAKQKAKQGEGHVTVDKSRKDAAPGQGSSEVSLPTGWEKKYDEANKKYYYIDHNSKKTYWHPPGTQQQKQGDGHAMIYKERLKEEGSGSGGGGGLKRSHSSPNIAKMIQDEEDASRRMRQTLPQQQQPQVDRTVKPKPSPQMFTVKTEVAEAKVRNLQPTWGNMGAGLTGLRNLGNTCYMNSTLQCLSNAAPLTVYFLTDWYTQDVVRDSSRRYRGEVASEYAVLVKAIWRGQYKALSPRDFRSVVCKMQPMFSSNQHQDSHELLEILMNGLNEDLNRVRLKPQLPEQNNDNIPDEIAAKQVWKQSLLIEDSIIVDLFRGQYKSTLSCLSCDKKSVMFEPFMCLNLPIPSPTRCSLSDCLLHFSKEEKMVGDSRWHCPRCKSYQDAVKRIVIWKLPPILIVHLERFYYQGIWRDKITANVDFPIDGLDMNRYISGPPERPLYSLFAVSNHFGTLDGGHYTAYCKSPVVGKWYKFDDQDVSETSRSDIKSSAAYMLFYSSMKMDQLKL